MRVPPRKLLGLLSLLAALAACGVTPTPVPVNPGLTNGLIKALPLVGSTPSGELDGTHRPVVGLKLSIEPLALLFTGKGQRQTVRVIARDAQGKIVRLKKKAVTWRITDPKLVKLGNSMGKSESEPDETLEISSNQDDDGNAITVTALADQGITNLSVELTKMPATRSADVPVTMHRLKAGVQSIPANKITVGFLESGPGGGFNANEIAASRTGSYPASAVIRSGSVPVGTVVQLLGSRGGLGRVASTVRRGEFSLIQLDFVGPEAVFAPYDFSRRVAFTADNLLQPGLRAQAGPIVPVPGFDVSLCKIISGASGIDITKLIAFEEFKPNLDPRIIDSSDGSSHKIGFAVGINPTGKVKISPTQALVGEGNPLKLKVRCSIDNLPVVPFTIAFAVGPVPVVIPTFFQAKPNFTFTVDATKVADLQLSAMLDDSPIFFQTAAKITSFIPVPLPFAVKAPGDETGINWATYRTKFKYDFSLVTGLANGFVPAKLALEVLPISVNIAWYLGLAAQPQLALDFVNVDVTALKSVLAWANGPFAAENKSGEGRRNVAYLSLKVAVSSNNLDQYTDALPVPAAAKVLVKNVLKTISSKISGSIGENFGEANHLPLKPGELKGDLPGFAAALQVLDAQGNEITRVPLNGDGSTPVSIEAGNKLRLLVQPELGDPEVGKDLLNLAGVKLTVTNKERFESLPILGNVWDYTNKDLVDPSGNNGPFIKFSFNGKSGLYPNSGQLAPVNPPDIVPDPQFFRMGGELVTVSQDLCDQIAKKGTVEWRFTAENKLVSAVSSSSYIGGATVSCGLDAEFYAGGPGPKDNKLVADGQEVQVNDCDLATRFAINFKPKATIKDLVAKLDGGIYLGGAGSTLFGGQESLYEGQRIFLTSGPHTLTAEAKDASNKVKIINRTFNIKCKEKLPPTINPPVIKAGNTVLGDGVTTFTVPVCPSDPNIFPLSMSTVFNPNGSSNTNALSITGMQIVVNSTFVGSVTYPDGSRPYSDSLTGSTEFITTGATITVSVIASETFKPANKFAKDYVKNVQVNYVAKPASECQPPPPPPQALCPPSSGPYALAATTPCPQDNNSGDVHLKTKDGYYYDFQGVGEFVLARSSLSDMPFEVQTRYHPYGSSVSITSAVAARVGTDRLTVYADTAGKPDVRINGQRIIPNVDLSWSQTLSDGGKLTMKENIALIVWKDGSNLTVWSYPGFGGVQNAILQVHPRHKGLTVGLGGNYNDNATDELTMRNGIVLPSNPTPDQLYNQFGKSWRLSDGESLFDYAPGQNTATFTDLAFPLGTPAPVITPTAQTAAEAICRAAGVTTAEALKGCIYDVVVTGDKSFASAAAKSDVKPLAPPPPAPQVIVDYVPGVWHVGEARTFTVRVLNSTAIPTWQDPGPGLTLVRNPNDPYRVTVTPTLAGCYNVYASILVNGIEYRNFYQFSYDVDRGNCNQT